jgi:hypothetical protein
LIGSIKLDPGRGGTKFGVMSDIPALARAFDIQAGACTAFGSPFSAAILDRAARDIESGGPLTGLVAPWRGLSTRTLVSEAIPIRWLGCAHDLVLSGEDPAVARAYPTPAGPGDPEAAWTALCAAMIARPERFAAFMNHEPQTNEVRRSACLLPGFLTVATQTGLPLRLFEIGASAGLNQLWDRYHYDLGAAGAWGDPVSPVRLDAAWSGGAPPLGAPAPVISRAACDRKPVDIRDPVARRRLAAYLWAGQFERLARLEAALAMALAADVRVDAEDAVSWTTRRAAPEEGAATVLYHSIFWQYLPGETQAALTAAIADLGARASATAPFAWLRMEPPPSNLADIHLRLTRWPGGEDRLLAHVHPHGASVDWVGGR